MKKASPKFSGSAYRILVLIKKLANKTYSFDEIVDILTTDEVAPKYITNDSIQKYLSTIRETGGEVRKVYANGVYKFSLEKFPFSFKLTEKSPHILSTLKKNIQNLHQKQLNEVFERVLNKILKYVETDKKAQIIERCSNVTYSPAEYKRYNKHTELIKKLEQTCIDNQRVTLIYKSPTEDEEIKILLEPKMLKYKKNKIYFIGYNAMSCERQGYLLDFIKEVRQSPQKSKYSNMTTPVTFKLKGRLAKGYRLYEDEKTIEKVNEDEIIVANYQEDRESLIQRILKYGENCEILTPEYLRENYIKILDDIEKNYASL